VAYERRAKKPDFIFLSGIYERAIAEAAKRRFAREAGAEEALRTFWLGYIDALVCLTEYAFYVYSRKHQRIHKDDEDSQLVVLSRACRSIPGYGELWAKYIRFLVRFSHCGGTAWINDVHFAGGLPGADGHWCYRIRRE
jgi:hypothetical protein